MGSIVSVPCSLCKTVALTLTCQNECCRKGTTVVVNGDDDVKTTISIDNEGNVSIEQSSEDETEDSETETEDMEKLMTILEDIIAEASCAVDTLTDVVTENVENIEVEINEPVVELKMEPANKHLRSQPALVDVVRRVISQPSFKIPE